MFYLVHDMEPKYERNIIDLKNNMRGYKYATEQTKTIMDELLGQMSADTYDSD